MRKSEYSLSGAVHSCVCHVARICAPSYHLRIAVLDCCFAAIVLCEITLLRRVFLCEVCFFRDHHVFCAIPRCPMEMLGQIFFLFYLGFLWITAFDLSSHSLVFGLDRSSLFWTAFRVWRQIWSGQRRQFVVTGNGFKSLQVVEFFYPSDSESEHSTMSPFSPV